MFEVSEEGVEEVHFAGTTSEAQTSDSRLTRIETAAEAWDALEELSPEERAQWSTEWVASARRSRLGRLTHVFEVPVWAEPAPPGSRARVDWELSIETGVRTIVREREYEPIIDLIVDRSRSIDFGEWVETLGLLFDLEQHGLLPWVRIWTFSGKVRSVGSDTDTARLAHLLIHSGPRGYTDIEQALRGVAPHGLGPIVLISDGKVTAGKDPRQVADFHRSISAYRIAADDQGQALLEEVCIKHGGEVFSRQSVREMLDTFRKTVLRSLSYER